jgi:hypothetical protein
MPDTLWNRSRWRWRRWRAAHYEWAAWVKYHRWPTLANAHAFYRASSYLHQVEDMKP